MRLEMATAIQGNGLNGSLVHLERENVGLNHQLVQVQDEPQGCVKKDDLSIYSGIDNKLQVDNSIVTQNELNQVQCSSTSSLNHIENDNKSASDEPEVDIVINNVVCSFSVRCHLNLRQIALTGCNVEYRRENGMVTMKLRKPYTTASIWSSGKITCTGATTEDMSKVAARRYARALQKLGFKTHFNNFRVVNVLGTCSMPFAIKINQFSERHKEAEYEPELHPGVTFKMKKPKATLKIFSTGSITVTAPSVSDVQQAIESIYPLVFEYRKERTKEEELALEHKQLLQQSRKRKLSSSDESGAEEC